VPGPAGRGFTITTAAAEGQVQQRFVTKAEDPMQTPYRAFGGFRPGARREAEAGEVAWGGRLSVRIGSRWG
jgi:hypothetical protein